MKKRVLATLSLVVAATFLFPVFVSAQDMHQTRSALDWEGRYIGTLPCASCPGIVTSLTITEAGFYTLTETYLGEKGQTFHSKGTFVWNKTGNRIILKGKDKRSYQIGEGFMRQTGTDGKPAGNEYLLRRQDEFNGNGEQLYVNPESLNAHSGKGTDRVRFDALLNFEHRMQGGHKSLTATVEIDCRGRTVDLPVIAYFSQHDAKGEKLASNNKNAGNELPLSENTDDVFVQAAKAYCR